jgi:hypothetical protein
MIRFVNADAVVCGLYSGFNRLFQKKTLVFLRLQRIMREESLLKMNEGNQIGANLFQESGLIDRCFENFAFLLLKFRFR